MKYLFILLATLTVTTQAFAGRSNAFRALVREVQCVTLESLPLQYEGVARVTFASGITVRMRFERGTNVDILNTCRELESAEGSWVTAIYNFDLTPPTDAPARIIHGFVHNSHSHIINGTVFGTRAVSEQDNQR
jgi:hypothetical protein